MQKFQELLTEAALLKQQKLKQQRKTYQSLPQFLKAGLGYSKRYQFLRQQNFYVQLYVAEKLKEEGNFQFGQKKYEEALTKYQEGLGIFRYIVSKTNENIKDQDITYKEYVPLENQRSNWMKVMSAFYLNICSCLTKLNKKEDAIRSADEAIQIHSTAKAHYKKAQAYLQYINKDNTDIKLGFYELNEAYKLSSDKSILEEMQRIKNEIQNERQKEKKWFKFMFDKQKQINSQQNPQKAINSQQNVQKKEPTDIQQRKQQIQANVQQKIKKQEKQQKKQMIKTNNQEHKIKFNEKKMEQETSTSTKKQSNELLQFISQASRAHKKTEQQQNPQKPNKTKEKLKKYVQMPSSLWKIAYQKQFMTKYGSKIYSMLHIYGYPDIAQEYRSILAKSLQKIQKQLPSQQIQQLNFNEYFTWLKNHPIDRIKKYIERYDLQLKWIEQQRDKSEQIKKQQLLQNAIKKQQKTNSCYYIIFGIIVMLLLLIGGFIVNYMII